MRISVSEVRTSRLWCSSCKGKIKKGDLAMFEIKGRKVSAILCGKGGGCDDMALFLENQRQEMLHDSALNAAYNGHGQY